MTSNCEKCKDGTFQDVEGQFGCKKCQPGSSTFGDDAKNFTSCKGENNRYKLHVLISSPSPCYDLQFFSSTKFV